MVRISRFAAVVVLACAAACPAQDGEGDWVELFNGKDLTGWVQKGGKAEYAIEGDAIVGKTVPNTPNSFLCTEKNYSDFVLEFEFRCDEDLNSGVQIRSNSLAEFKNGRVHGYQIEIDPSVKRNRWWSAGVYDEGRRGWLFPGKNGGDAKAFTEQGAKLTKRGEWNKVRVEAVGTRIRTWLNDELRADFTDDMTPTGFIALQVHSVGKREDTLEVRWRAIRIREVTAE